MAQTQQLLSFGESIFLFCLLSDSHIRCVGMEGADEGPVVVVEVESRHLLMRTMTSLKRRLADHASQPQLKLTVDISSTSRRIGWLFVLFLHSFNVVYVTGVLVLYEYMTQTTTSVYRGKLDMMAPAQYIWIKSVYGIVSILNAYCAITMIYWSLRYRRLAFGEAKAHVLCNRNPSCSILSATMSKLLAVLKPLGIRGHLFDDVLIARELMEIASQTYQAYSSSVLVSSVWINQMFAAVILFNCMSEVILGFMTSIPVGRRRFICTVIDLVLDFVWGFLLPARVLFIYVPIFVRNGYAFPASFIYADTDFTNALLEMKQFFITSNFDAVTTIHPYINSMSSLRNLKILLLCGHEDLEISNSVHPTQIASGDTPNNTATTLIEADTIGLQQMHAKNKAGHKNRCSLHHVLHALIAAIGLGVWVTSLQASNLFGSDRCNNDCKLQVHPWFSTGCVCSVHEINCFKRGITGEASQIASIMQALDAKALNYLIISHCSELTVPADIRRFPRLLGLQFYNTTLVDWPRSASLSLPYLGRLDFVYVVRSRFLNGLPEGITYNIASSLQDLEFVASDIGNIPNDVDETWPKLMVLLIEHCGLQTFPRSLANIPELVDLSLVGNNISSVPDDRFASHASMLILSLDGNPIATIPEIYATMASWFVLTVQDTQVASMPEAIGNQLQKGLIHVSAYNTPLCANSSTDPSSVGCRSPSARVRNGHFPLALVDSIRAKG